MSKFQINLYTFLIDNVNAKFCFGRLVDNAIESGRILVNDSKPTDINMFLNIGDIVTINSTISSIDYVVNEECLKAYIF